jgi:hypothetical protein
MLANSSLTVNPGSGLTGGGPVSLGGSVSLTLDMTKVPTLAAPSNAFSGSIAASSFTGSGAGLTGLNASNLSAGTVPSTALSGTYNITIGGNAASATIATNATNLGGNPPSFYAAASSLSSYLPLTGGTLTGSLNGTAGSFSGALTASGGAVLTPTGTATSGNPANSNPLDLIASSFSSGNAVNQKFRWQAEGNGSTNAGTLSLLYASGNGTPAETGLSIGNNGLITFAAGQTFPDTGNGTITGVTVGTGLSGGGTSGSVAVNLDTTKVPTLTAPTNTFNGGIVAGSFVGNGAGLTNVAAQTAVTANDALNLGGLPASAYQPVGSYPTAAAAIVGSLPKWTGTSSLGSSPIKDSGGTLTSSEPLAAPSITTTGTGTATVRLGNTGPSWTSGTGAPTGACVVGSLYSRTDGGAASTLYVCEGPSGAWMAK